MGENGGQRTDRTEHIILMDTKVSQNYNGSRVGERETGSPGLKLCPSTRELHGNKGARWSLKQVPQSLWVSVASSENEMAQINNL